MRTLTRRLAPHARTAWLTLVAATVLVVAVVVVAVLAAGGGRFGVVATIFSGVVVFGVLAAFLDAILVPGNPDAARQAGHAAGWTGAIASGGGRHSGAGDGSCG